MPLPSPWRTRVGKYGITVNAVDPGPTDTGCMTQETRQELLPRYSLGRLGKPEDAAQLVAFLISSEADWITGQTIRSRGGVFFGVFHCQLPVFPWPGAVVPSSFFLLNFRISFL